MQTLKVFITDDHTMIRNGIKALLKEDTEIEIVGEASDGEEAIQKVKEMDVDIILLDIKMPKVNGIEAAKIIKQKKPEVKILALTMEENEKYIMGMIDAGASGYVLKNSDEEELLRAIKTLGQGENYFSREVSNKIIARLSRQGKGEGKTLSGRELEIVTLIVREYTNQEIADKLDISKRTVDTHRTNILKKLNLKNTAGLVKYALENELVI